MPRASGLALLVLLLSNGGSAQPLSVLHVKVTLLDAAKRPTPVPRHALLVSDNPPSDAPRRVITAAGGTLDIRLRPGLYSVESDVPVAFEGRLYQWAQVVEIVEGRDAVLELTADNAEISAAPQESAERTATPQSAPSFLLPRWQDSVVAIWTPSSRVSGFLADARGVIATSRRAIGEVTSVEVELSPSLKIAGQVVVADVARDVALVRVDPVAVAALPVPLRCPAQPAAAVASGQELFSIGIPFRGSKDLVVGEATVSPAGQSADFRLESGSVGGPVFTAAGDVVGLTSLAGVTDDNARGDVPVVGIAGVCEALAAAVRTLSASAPPSGAPLPVEPTRAVPLDTAEGSGERAVLSVARYQLSSSDFDVTFITPKLAGAAQRALEDGRTGGGVSPEVAWERERLLTDFANWSEYFAEVRPVLLVRVTPRLAEGFWTKVARGAALTQGVRLPPIKRRRPGFSRMRAFCGDREVIPIHPFVLESRVSDTDAMREGLYVYSPDALGQHCGAARLLLHSEKEPGRADTLTIDAKLLETISQDLSHYRTP